MTSGYITAGFSGSQRWVEMLHYPLVFGVHTKEEKTEVGTSPLRSLGPKIGWRCYITFVFLRVPGKGDIITSGYITLAFSGAQDWAQLQHNLCVLGGPPKRGQR